MWITPNEALILTQFTPQESASITAIQGATDNLPAIATAVIAEIRGYIAAGSYDVDLTSETTIPPSLQNDFVALSRWRYLVSMPQLAKLQTDKREKAFSEALAKLEKIARQQWNPGSPTAPLTKPGARWNSENKLIMRTHPLPPPRAQFPDRGLDGPPYANPEAPRDA